MRLIGLQLTTESSLTVVSYRSIDRSIFTSPMKSVIGFTDHLNMTLTFALEVIH